MKTNPKPITEQFLTFRDCGERYAVAPNTIYRWARETTFPKAIKLGSSTRWRLSDLLEWEAKQGVAI